MWTEVPPTFSADRRRLASPAIEKLRQETIEEETTEETMEEIMQETMEDSVEETIEETIDMIEHISLSNKKADNNIFKLVERSIAMNKIMKSVNANSDKEMEMFRKFEEVKSLDKALSKDLLKLKKAASGISIIQESSTPKLQLGLRSELETP